MPPRVGNVDAKPGTVGYGSLGEVYLPDGTEVKIPLIVVHGARPGPTLMVSSTIHGTEIVGADVIRTLVHKSVDPKKLAGSLLCLPILNPLAFHDSVYTTPQDSYNMNRVFPGSATGPTTHRMAEMVMNRAIRLSDCLIDFHATPFPSMPFSLVREVGGPTDRPSLDMATAFGLTTVKMVASNEPHRSGTILDNAISLGKAGMGVEAHYWRRMVKSQTQMGTKGVLNVMKHLKMLDGKPEPQTDLPILKGNLSRVEITANKGGFVDFLCEPGERVSKGQPIADVWDPYGRTVETLKSPVDGNVLSYPMLGNQAAATGDTIAYIAYRLK